MGAPVLNRGGVTFQIVTVVTAATPVQGPSIIVPYGFALVVQQRRHSGGPTGYVAVSSAAALLSANRKELHDGEGIVLHITNANLLWFNADADATVFELFVEQ